MTSTTVCTAYGPISRFDYGMIMAVGEDKANRLMRKDGRKRWNDDDLNASTELVDKLARQLAERYQDGARYIAPRKAAA